MQLCVDFLISNIFTLMVLYLLYGSNNNMLKSKAHQRDEVSRAGKQFCAVEPDDSFHIIVLRQIKKCEISRTSSVCMDIENCIQHFHWQNAIKKSFPWVMLALAESAMSTEKFTAFLDVCVYLKFGSSISNWKYIFSHWFLQIHYHCIRYRGLWHHMILKWLEGTDYTLFNNLSWFIFEYIEWTLKNTQFTIENYDFMWGDMYCKDS
jgi:hypothetical protein